MPRGDRVFLDLKFHDIPNTVAGAVAAATRLGVWMVNVHASGGARDDARGPRGRGRRGGAAVAVRAPLVIAVTVLTSLDEAALREIGCRRPMAAQVERLAALAQAAGLDGVVASPQEIALIRRAVRTSVRHRHARHPRARRRQGRSEPDADRGRGPRRRRQLLVVGRPIIAAADPRAAAERIAAECRAAKAS